MKNEVNPIFQRVGLLTGEDALKKFQQTRVLVFGLGGVGSWCAEALARSGIGKIGIVDFDTVAESNINRQIQATGSTVGQAKAAALQERLLDINPHCEVTAWNTLFSCDTAAQFEIASANFVIDAIDSLNHKLDLIELSYAVKTTLFSSMGMARKNNPERIRIASIWKTNGCPLARNVREGLRKRNFNGNFDTVYSDENITPCGQHQHTEENAAGKKKVNGSLVTVTAVAGIMLASLVLRDIMERQ